MWTEPASINLLGDLLPILWIREMPADVTSSLIVLLSGGLLLVKQLNETPSGRDSWNSNAFRHRTVEYVKRAGFLLLLTPLVLMGGYLIPLLLITLFIGIVFLIACRRRVDQGAVLWTLALGIRSGSDLVSDLESIANGLSVGHRRKVIKLADRLYEGWSLDEALEKVAGVVPHSAVLAARAGARNGTLAESLQDAAVRHTKRLSPDSNVSFSPTLVVMYVVAVPVLALMILSGLMIYIIPKYKAIFEGFGTELPVATIELIHFSDFMAEFGILWLLMIFMALLAVLALAIAYILGFGEFDFPLAGRWFRRLDLPNVLRIFASTIEQNRPLDETVNTLCVAHRRSAVRKSMNEVYQLMRSGEDPWRAMRSQGLITNNESAALQSAARAGNLPWALEQIADSVERRSSLRWRTWLEFLQPLIVILMGMGVAFICLGMFMPLIKLLNDLS